MEMSRQSPAPARYTGIGIVIAVHVVAITALSLGFIKPTVKHDGPTEFRQIKEAPPPKRDPDPVVEVQQPKFAPIPFTPVLPIPWDTERPPTITTQPLTDTPPVAPPTGPVVTAKADPTPAAQPTTTLRQPGAVCSVMPRPEVPVLNWTGDAVLQVMATVRGGRVVGTEFRVLQGALDSKSRRALQRSVESALLGYQCQGDATFQQDFAFKID